MYSTGKTELGSICKCLGCFLALCYGSLTERPNSYSCCNICNAAHEAYNSEIADSTPVFSNVTYGNTNNASSPGTRGISNSGGRRKSYRYPCLHIGSADAIFY